MLYWCNVLQRLQPNLPHMNTQHFSRIAVLATVLCFVACTKDEPAAKAEVATAQETKKLSVPLKDGRTHIALADNALSRTSGASQASFLNRVTQILTPDDAYVNSTRLMDLSVLTSHYVTGSVEDKRLKLTFTDSVMMMPGYPNGWTALWNSKPFVEQDAPDVLYTQQRNRLTIQLSKYVETFGFELAPNLYDAYEFTVGFYDSKENPPVATLTQSAATPMGAKLFAVKSKRPFNVIEISFNGDNDSANQPYGFAIANIRYILCKEDAD